MDTDELEESANSSLSTPTTTLTNRVSVEKERSNAERKRKLISTEVKSQESPSSQLISYILAEKQAKKTMPNSEQHPVDAFLVGIAQPLKTLDPIRLLSAKWKIFNIVQELELQQLTANSQHQNSIAYIYPAIPSVQTSSSSTPSYITLSEEGGPFADNGPPSIPNHISTPILDSVISENDTNLTFFQI